MPEVAYVKTPIAPLDMLTNMAKRVGGIPWDVITWTDVDENDTFEAVRIHKPIVECAIVARGTFGGATVVLQGSVDGTNYFDLADGKGNAISITAAGIVAASIAQITPYIKPSASSGSSQSLTLEMALLEAPTKYH